MSHCDSRHAGEFPTDCSFGCATNAEWVMPHRSPRAGASERGPSGFWQKGKTRARAKRGLGKDWETKAGADGHSVSGGQGCTANPLRKYTPHDD